MIAAYTGSAPRSARFCALPLSSRGLSAATHVSPPGMIVRMGGRGLAFGRRGIACAAALVVLARGRGRQKLGLARRAWRLRRGKVLARTASASGAAEVKVAEGQDAIKEYRAAKADVLLSSWLVDDDGAVQRLVGVFAVLAVLFTCLISRVFPFADEDGLVFNNICASVFFAAGLAVPVPVGLMLFCGSRLQRIDKLLRMDTFVVATEDAKDTESRSQIKRMRSKGNDYIELQQKDLVEARRDQLISDSEVKPAIERIRPRILVALGALPIFLLLGKLAGGEAEEALPLTEEEELRQEMLRQRDAEMTFFQQDGLPKLRK